MNFDSSIYLEQETFDNTSDNGNIKVWIKIEGNNAEKIKISRSADIDDLKEQLFSDKETKRSYCVYYENREMPVGENIPLDTSSDRPIALKKNAGKSIVNFRYPDKGFKFLDLSIKTNDTQTLKATPAKQNHG